ncbi:hypothetical protein V1264_009499 [Littorina saxatilis]|uniref:adenylate cyclase n=1 Tax=Littorina saxatilis TaxID=31220 RepID=A0AAN9G210_9CAEN
MADAQAPGGMTARRNSNPSSSSPGKPAGSVHVTYGRSQATITEVVFGHFPNEAEESLFQLYIRDQKLKIIPAFAFTCVIYLVAQIILELMVPATLSERLAPMIVLFGLIAFLVATLVVLNIKKDKSYQWTSVCIMAMWFVITTAILFSAGTKRSAKSSTGVVGWLQLQFFISFVVLPWRLRVVIAISCLAAVAHSLEGGLLWVLNNDESSTHSNNDMLARQVAANSLLFLGAILLGVLVFLFSDRKQRRSFVESKKSHTISFQLQKEYREQERLLLSVLPKHIADEMIHDLGSDATGGQFRKIYMSRHENVSILFADIVGFTAISSSVTAAELVKILNQLFASFDDLAHKYHQQRIKILGDCYYCVCGALDLRKDHGVLSIHMGMSMVDAIRAVRERTHKDVNMRVGIHTGPVLGGVLGQRQWQYDVLGKEVTCANHMESGGVPGRVHISETTKALLNGEFELEPGNGFARDDYLKLANMQTYLIKSIIKPYPLGTLDEHLDENRKTGQENDERISLNSEEECNVSQNQHLREALLDRKRSTEAMKLMNYYTTWFHDKEAEARYRARSERFSGASMGALCVVLLLVVCAKFAVLPRTLVAILTFLVAELILATMAYISSIYMLQKVRIQGSPRTPLLVRPGTPTFKL